MANIIKIGEVITGDNYEAEMNSDYLYVKLRDSRVISNAVMNGGVLISSGIINYSLFGKKDCQNKPVEYLRNILLSKRIDYSSVVGLLTAVRPDRFVVSRNSLVTTFISAGVDNAATPMDALNYSGHGTINIIAIAKVKMIDSAMVDAFKTSVEAKSYSLWTRRVISKFSGKVATGTITDVTAIISNQTGEEYRYAGTGTDLGSALSASIFDALTYALDNFYNYKSED